MAPRLALPPQLSTDPLVNQSAMAWAGLLIDQLQRRLTTLYAFVATSETYNSGSYGNPATTGPSLTLPAGGDYLLLFGARMTTTGALADILFASPSIAGATPLDADAVESAFPASGGSTIGQSVTGAIVTRGRSAGDVITLQYKRVNNSFSVANRWLVALPLS